jgi:hypothetical protein
MQRHLVDFLGNLSGKTKQFVTFEIKFVSHINLLFYAKLFYKVLILVAVTVSGDYRTFFDRKKTEALVIVL